MADLQIGSSKGLIAQAEDGGVAGSLARICRTDESEKGDPFRSKRPKGRVLYSDFCSVVLQ